MLSKGPDVMVYGYTKKYIIHHKILTFSLFPPSTSSSQTDLLSPPLNLAKIHFFLTKCNRFHFSSFYTGCRELQEGGYIAINILHQALIGSFLLMFVKSAVSSAVQGKAWGLSKDGGCGLGGLATEKNNAMVA